MPSKDNPEVRRIEKDNQNAMNAVRRKISSGSPQRSGHSAERSRGGNRSNSGRKVLSPDCNARGYMNMTVAEREEVI